MSRTNMKFLLLIAGSLLAVAGHSPAVAAGGDSTDGKWEFSLAPLFLWAQGIKGDATLGPSTTPLDITFKDALDNLDGTFTVHYEMKRDALSLFAEYQYVSLDPEVEGPGDIKLKVKFKNTIAEMGAAYWVYGTPKTDWELIGGARYTKQDVSVAVKNGPDLIDTDSDWWVGFIGGRFTGQLSEKWSFRVRADFGVGSGKTNQIWNLNAMFDYRFKQWGSVFAGYKYMNYDYNNGNKGTSHYEYDASQQGPLVGLNFYW